MRALTSRRRARSDAGMKVKKGAIRSVFLRRFQRAIEHRVAQRTSERARFDARDRTTTDRPRPPWRAPPRLYCTQDEQRRPQARRRLLWCRSMCANSASASQCQVMSGVVVFDEPLVPAHSTQKKKSHKARGRQRTPERRFGVLPAAPQGAYADETGCPSGPCAHESGGPARGLAVL